jgi:hypothetical protein
MSPPGEWKKCFDVKWLVRIFLIDVFGRYAPTNIDLVQKEFLKNQSCETDTSVLKYTWLGKRSGYCLQRKVGEPHFSAYSR